MAKIYNKTMNLHRTSGKPDWDVVTPSSRNLFQKIAVTTHGIVTPANIISAIGLGIVLYGLVMILSHDFLLGLIMVAIGRLLDIVDGVVAEATRTKSPLGEMVDAVADKVGTLLTIGVLVVVSVADWWVIAALLVPQLVIPLVIFYKGQKGIHIHPTRPGKLSMAMTWVGIAGLLLVRAIDIPELAIVVYVVIGVALLLGLYALWQYATGRDQTD